MHKISTKVSTGTEWALGKCGLFLREKRIPQLQVLVSLAKIFAGCCVVILYSVSNLLLVTVLYVNILSGEKYWPAGSDTTNGLHFINLRYKIRSHFH